MSPQQPNDPLIGRLVDGRYRVRARIARGGMATVYVATDLRLERRIALKVMHAHLSDDQVFQGRFIQEARAAARLADPHVVNVFDQGQDGELAYLVMEYLPGITLRELLKEQRRLSITQTVTVMDAILAGLAAAHKADIVHRDVKPENVLLAEDGRIKIGDFGLARATTANTASGAQLMGTIAYLAPELVTRGTADARSDIYSLGIMLYEMLVGEQPYRGEQPMQIAFQHATDSVPRPSAKNPAVPEQLDELVLWATEKDPQQRPLDAQVMLDRLREIEREIGVSPAVTDAEPLTGQTVILDEYDTGGQTSVFPVTAATTIAPSETTQTPAPAQPADNATRLRRLTARKQRRGTILLAVVLLLAIIAAGAGWYFGNGPGSRVAVPAVSGQNFESSSAKIDSAGLVAARGEGYSATVPAGEVIETDPESGRQVDKGSTVTLIVSLGPQEHQIPSYLGLSEDEVVKNLKALDIKAAEKDRIYEYSPDAEANTLTWLTIIPANGSDLINCDAGCTAFGGDSAKLYVSLGEFTDVTGMTLKEARASLKSQKLTITNEWGEYNPDVDVDTVIWMSAAPDGRGYRPGDSVDLQYSLGPVAEVAGMTLEKAKAALTAQQITIAAENHEYSDSVPAGQVIAMTGAPEDRFLRPFDSVSLTISDGKRPIVVPDLSGKTIREAMTELGALGLSPTTELPDIFIPTIGNMWDKYYFGSTDPAVGSTLYEGDSITVTVAT